MLYQYRKDYEKITMGLLSLITEFSNMDLVTQEMEWYDQSDQRQILLWQNDAHNWAGLLGVEEHDDQVVIHQFILTPQNQTQSSCNQMLDELAAYYNEKQIVGSLSTHNILKSWEQTKS
ncbi:reductase [Lentilactobacillus sp. SPB1-3]|uniref:Reductase n=1 Tax=Lentilactobacillus terminaliae TaxID=3003483 RepID=A0ACD5DC35_9LACO|nr:reductase [Lentilactobacillus sp. SPB1-3]MCZ0977260.1 reductase [Lentilactobacillus sp. SPB1-3]